MARASNPTAKKAPAKRAAAPQPARQQGIQNVNRYDRAMTEKRTQQANTRRVLGIRDAQSPAASAGPPAYSAYYRAGQQGQNVTLGRVGFNPNMTRAGTQTAGRNQQYLMQNSIRQASIPAGPQTPYGYAPPRQTQQQYGQYGSGPVQQWQYGPQQTQARAYAPQSYNKPIKPFQVIPGAPQWLQDQVGQQQMGWGSGSMDPGSRQEVYDYQMANYYAKGEPYVEPPSNGGGYADWGGGGWGGGGGGGGYTERPAEWYERMLSWKY